MLNTLIKHVSYPTWITDKYIYVMLFVYPLFTGFEGYTNITLSKYIFFASFTSLWLMVLLALEIKSMHFAKPGRTRLISLLLILYFVFCCLSAVFSSFKSSVLIGGGRFDGLVTVLLCICIFLGISRYSRPKPAYIYAVAASMSLNCIVAVLQIMGHNPLHLFPGDYTYYDAGIKFSSVFLGTIGNADLFSAFLCLTLPLAAVYYITAAKRTLLLLPAVVLSTFCLFVCGVSGGILAIAVCALAAAPFLITNGERLRRMLEISFLLAFSVLVAISLKFVAEGPISLSFSKKSSILLVLTFSFIFLRLVLAKRDFNGRSLKLFFSGLSLTSIVAGIAAAYFWSGTEGTIYEISQVLHGNIDDSFGSSRILIWRSTLDLVPERLLLGGGPGTLPDRLDLSFSRFVKETGKTLESYVDNAHNDYLSILVNTGLLSLISYLAAQCVSLVKAVKTSKGSLLTACLACSLLCYWIQAFFGLGLFLVSPLMWLTWGLLASGLHPRKVKCSIEPETVTEINLI